MLSTNELNREISYWTISVWRSFHINQMTSSILQVNREACIYDYYFADKWCLMAFIYTNWIRGRVADLLEMWILRECFIFLRKKKIEKKKMKNNVYGFLLPKLYYDIYILERCLFFVHLLFCKFWLGFIRRLAWCNWKNIIPEVNALELWGLCHIISFYLLLSLTL